MDAIRDLAREARSDEDLLRFSGTDPQLFAVFYRRHARDVLAYFARRTHDPELAADLTAETFASALAGRERFDCERGAALAWLYGIAHHQLDHAQRRGRAETRARQRLGMQRIVLDDEALERIEALAGSVTATATLSEAMRDLPADQRDAVAARVVDELPYTSIASNGGTTLAVARKRVSRGLAFLRTRLERADYE